MADVLRMGILGYGRFAERAIAPAIRKVAQARLVAIQKRTIAEAKQKAGETGIALAFDSVDELVRHPEVDAVFIVSANGSHCGNTLAAARAGKHVIVEKPMALTVAEAEMMIRTCEEHGVKLMVGHMVRLSPAVMRARELVESGIYGGPIFARADFFYNARLSRRNWLFDTAVAGGGPVYDVGVHCLDTLRYVLDDEVVSVRAHMMPPPNAKRTETTAHLSLQFSHGVPASIFCSYATPYRAREMEIVCSEAVITVPSFTAVGDAVKVFVRTGKMDDPVPLSEQSYDVPDLYAVEVGMFCDAIASGSPFEMTGENGLRNMRVIEEAIRQCRKSA